MKEKRPIDRIRNSGGHANIGTPEDGAIIEMKNIGGRLIIIKERSIYEMVFADKIDPERKNINLPPTINKLIIDKGAESEVVARVLLTAKTIFKPEYLIDTIDCDAVLSLVIDMLSEIFILEKEINEYSELEKKEAEAYNKRRTEKNAFQLPSIVNLESRCKTIFQKADHIEQILMDIIFRFYPNHLTKQSHFPKFHDVIKSIYGDEDSFSKFIENTLYFMTLIRNLRNEFDHRLDKVKVTNFELQENGSVLSPTIELKNRYVKLERTSLKNFLDITNKNLVEIIEVTFGFLAGRNVRTTGMKYQLREIPENKRKHKFVRYCFWMPISKEGHYCQ